MIITTSRIPLSMWYDYPVFTLVEAWNLALEVLLQSRRWWWENGSHLRSDESREFIKFEKIFPFSYPFAFAILTMKKFIKKLSDKKMRKISVDKFFIEKMDKVEKLKSVEKRRARC